MSFADFQELRKLVEYAGAPRHHGVSSNALVMFGFNRGPRPSTPGQPIKSGALSWRGEECGRDYPMDRSDLAACQRVVRLARRAGVDPEVVARMESVLPEFEAWVIDGRNRHGAALRTAK